MSVTLNDLPEEVLHKTFSYLPAEDLARGGEVNKQMNKIASDDMFWREHFPDIPKDFNIKDCLRNGISERWKILKNFNDFVQQVPFNRNGRFEVVFPCDPIYSIFIDFSYNLKRDTVPDVQRKMYLLRKLPRGLDSGVFGELAYRDARVLGLLCRSPLICRAEYKIAFSSFRGNCHFVRCMGEIVRNKIPDWEKSAKEARARRIKKAAMASAMAGGVALSAVVANKLGNTYHREAKEL